MLPIGERVTVRARVAGTLFLSRSGKGYGSRLWEVEARIGKRRVRKTLVGSAREIRRGLAKMIDRKRGAR